MEFFKKDENWAKTETRGSISNTLMKMEIFVKEKADSHNMSSEGSPLDSVYAKTKLWTPNFSSSGKETITTIFLFLNQL